MEIVGIGTQIVDCTKVRKLIDRHGEAFLMQVYTDREMRFCNGRTHVTEHYTAIWAAKEAVLRSLGTTWQRSLAWTDIEVLCRKGETPQVKLHGALADLLPKRGVSKFLLSMAHSRLFATATSIAVK
jgi:holo-[acyl-carrier protein] synthase